jgi:hypothetical protein
MRLTDLAYAPEFSLPDPFILSRIQRARVPAGAVAIGPLKLAPRGTLRNRFDLLDDEVGYFAESAEAAVYETLARREAIALSMSVLRKRVLLTLRSTLPLKLLDLRPHASSWPVLQSLRYRSTQELAKDARDLGYTGIVYRSAQQFGSDCFALFGPAAMSSLRQESKHTLVSPAGALHRAAAAAVRGSQIPLVP